MRLRKIVQSHVFEKSDAQIFKNLQKFQDNRNIWRVKTRLTLSEETFNFKYPVVIPSRHPLVEKLIWTEHVNSKHAGLNTLMALLRERFWIIKARKTVRRIILRCVICLKLNTKSLEVTHAPLPLDRITCSAAFEITGVDLAGPLFLRNRRKCWIVLFTCAVYRAIHLEVVRTLTTEDFISALRRFIARRGRVSTIYSDNGTNFRGTFNLLNNLDWSKISTFSCARKINWKFSPPSAAWWGGW